MAQLDEFCGKCEISIEEHEKVERNLAESFDQHDKISIQCDCCSSWYHLSCANLQEYEIEDIDRYHCEKCVEKIGPTMKKILANTHRNDCCDTNAAEKPVECGTVDFVKHLKSRNDFPSFTSVVYEFENGLNLDVKYLESTSFDKPMLIHNMAGLEMKIPKICNVDELEHLIDDPRLTVDVIDCQRQKDYKMKFATFLDLYRQKYRLRTYNVISLEFSKTKLSPLVELPRIAEEISWVHQFWPKSHEKACQFFSGGKPVNLALLGDHFGCKPEVAKFCLISMRDSYTDFHVDFGGTSVWYHIAWGEKIFYLIEPTESNLALYDDWMRASNKAERFFGDEVEKCYAVHLAAGQTFFIPTGWIHAVLTPADSLVFGGNFLHSFNIPLQLKVYEMELSCATYEKYMFPNYELVNWYAGYNFLDHIKELNDEKLPLKRYLNVGVHALVAHMKLWLDRSKNREAQEIHYVEKIESLTFVQLVKKLEKSLKANERLQQDERRKRSLKLSSYAKRKQKKLQSFKIVQNSVKTADNFTTKSEDSPLKFVFKFRDDVLHDSCNEKTEENFENRDDQSRDTIKSLDDSQNTTTRDVLSLENSEYLFNGLYEICPPAVKLDSSNQSFESKDSLDISKNDISRSDQSTLSKNMLGSTKSHLTMKFSLKKSTKRSKNAEVPVKICVEENCGMNSEFADDFTRAKDQILSLSSIFGISQRGRVQKINPALNDSIEFGLDDTEDEEDYVEETPVFINRSKNISPDIVRHSQADQSTLRIDGSDQEYDQPSANKLKKKKPTTVKQRLAAKMKFK